MRLLSLRILFAGCALIFAFAWPLAAGDVSYVMLQRYPTVRLVRVSGDGRSETTIARGVSGYGLAVDKNGDYIVAAVSSLLRVSSSGAVSQIAPCPAGSQWVAVAIDAQGNYIAADNVQHSIWRISTGGQVQRVAAYPVNYAEQWNSAGVMVDAAGNYLLVEDNGFTGHFWRITPSGSVAAIPLSGDPMRASDSIIEDGAGGYFVASLRDSAIFRVTSSGHATRFANVAAKNLSGLARDPQTGNLVVGQRFGPRLRLIDANGIDADGIAVNGSVTEFGEVGYTSAIVAEAGR